MGRWLKRITVTVLVLALLLAVTVGVMARRSFPQTSGAIELRGLDADVKIVRSDQGIPQITATTSHDLFFAQGFVHAQDRFWQMDFWRHIGAGRLSELFGADQISTDVFLRTMGWARVAAQEYALLSDETRAALDAYSEGVNAYLADRSPSRASFEYVILGLQNSGYEIEPWDPVDTITWTKVMAWELRANLDEELDRAILAAEFGVDRAEEMYPPYPADFPVIVDTGTTAAIESPDLLVGPTALQQVGEMIAKVDAVAGVRFEGIGSNNWVLAGDHTASGKPLLANDPHLGIQMPSIWYENGLRCRPVTEDCPYDVVGFSFAGAPGVVIGHNDQIAWGLTNEAPDSMDVFIEETDDQGRYRVGDTWQEFDVVTETIMVAGGTPTQVEVKSTRHGPVITGVYSGADLVTTSEVIDTPENFVLALSWTALEPSRTVQAILEYNRASSWDEFRGALTNFEIAAQNFVYADIDGNIGYQATGRVPIRDGWTGRYPMTGWNTPPADSFVAPSDLPHLFNPAEGYIVTANEPVNRTTAGGDGIYIGSDHSSGYRASRIRQLLGTVEQATVADMASLQLDLADASAAFLVPLALSASSSNDSAVVDLLEQWEEPYLMEADSASAAAYAGFWRHLLLRTLADEFPDDGMPVGHSRLFAVMRQLGQDADNRWWDDVTTSGVESRDDIIAGAIADADSELTDLLGADPTRWRWGDLHTATFENQTLGKSGISPIEAIFNRKSPSELGGGGEIVNAIGWTSFYGYEVDWIPSLRMVVDLSDLEDSVAIHSTGQSGHTFHPNYFDLNQFWVQGSSLALPWGDVEGEVLTLRATGF